MLIPDAELDCLDIPVVQQQDVSSNHCGFFCVAWLLGLVIEGRMPDTYEICEVTLRSSLLSMLDEVGIVDFGRFKPGPRPYSFLLPSVVSNDVNFNEDETNFSVMSAPVPVHILASQQLFRASAFGNGRQTDIRSFVAKK